MNLLRAMTPDDARTDKLPDESSPLRGMNEVDLNHLSASSSKIN
jgi:hypothetical protein